MVNLENKCLYRKTSKRRPWAFFLFRTLRLASFRDGLNNRSDDTNCKGTLLKRRPWSSFRDGFLFKITFANSRRGAGGGGAFFQDGLLLEIKPTGLLFEVFLWYIYHDKQMLHLGNEKFAIQTLETFNSGGPS